MSVPRDIVAAIARRLAERAGLELPIWVVEARAATRFEVLWLAPAAYVDLIESSRGGAELDALVEAVRVGETRLFRHRAQIAALCDDIVPLLRATGRRSIRVWSAGCAGGEEPYTLAIVLSRALPNTQVEVVATDVSADAIAAAQAGSYRASALADVPEPWRDAFVIEEDRLRIRPELAALVRFERANLVDGATPKNCDVVWCRNVLIYFSAEARKRAIERIVSATVAGGYVFVGYSESLRDVTTLDAVRSGEAVYYVKRGVERTAKPSAPKAVPAPRKPAPADRGGDSGAWTAEQTPWPTRMPTLSATEDLVSLVGEPSPREVTSELATRLGIAGLERLVVDLDAAELLVDELAPVLRRARAAATTAHVVLELRATRPGTRRWLVRHGLADDMLDREGSR